MSRTTINDIFRANGKRYRKKYPGTPLGELKVMRSIEICRTDEMGARVERCDTCNHTVIINNSCRNRHCPLCQNIKKEEWIAARKNEVLPVTYFHIVFTLPDILNQIAWKNKKIIFNLLFHVSKKTLLSIAAEDRYFGADIGFFSVLHTWGQKLNLHPHVHCVVPGGGFSKKDGRWRNVPNNYLAPVKVVKARFKELFIRGLRLQYESGTLYLKGTDCEDEAGFKRLLNALYEKEWVVYLKESFNNSSSVIEYLSRYTHKIAIANHRIVSFKDGIVEFTYRDYKDGNRQKTAMMDALVFMRKFLMHTVPGRFVRIRYFGIFSHRNKQHSLARCRESFGLPAKAHIPSGWRDIFKHKKGIDYSLCPECRKGRLYVDFYVQGRFGVPP